MKSPNLTVLRMTVANLCFKPLSAIFNIILLAMGVAIIIALIHLDTQVNQLFTKDLQGIDLVVSGKGSPLQIILSSVFQLDVPTGNIPVQEANRLKTNPLIQQIIPLALGDNYNGYRIVGTNSDYIDHYKGHLSQGHVFTQPMEAVLGSEVAEKYQLHIGETLIGAHGLVNSDDLHTDFPYTITGILDPTGTVLDRLVLTPVESVWHVHEHPDADDPEEIAYKKKHPDHELTALLIAYRSPLAAAQLPRLINTSSSMQAASPAFEVARLAKLIGTGKDILSAFGFLLIGFAVFGFFVTQYNAVNERRYDIALMRVLGASRTKIVFFILNEVFTLGIMGTIGGVILAHLFLILTAFWIHTTQHITLEAIGFNTTDIYVCLAALGISLSAAILPAVKAYKINIIKTLAET